MPDVDVVTGAGAASTACTAEERGRVCRGMRRGRGKQIRGKGFDRTVKLVHGQRLDRRRDELQRRAQSHRSDAGTLEEQSCLGREEDTHVTLLW